MIAIRWVTWWPAPYWTDRFNFLASRSDVDLEVIFLSAGAAIHGWVIDTKLWGFRHFVLSDRRDSSGYFCLQYNMPKPRRLVSGNVDALIMPYADATCLSAALICRALRKPYFLFVANTVKDQRRESRWKECIKHVVFGAADGILATGELQKEYALQYCDERRIHIVGNPSQYYGDYAKKSLSNRPIFREQFGWEKKVVLLYVGRLSPEKGLSLLLDALGECKARGILPKLVLAGAGPLQSELHEHAVRLGLDVEFLGYLQDGELSKCYAAVDVFVLPSISEPWGLVVNEAMEFELPLLLSENVGATPQLLRQGETGFSYPAGDVAMLARHIEVLFRDEVLRKRMGMAAKQLVQQHSILRWADAVVSAVSSTRRSPEES